MEVRLVRIRLLSLALLSAIIAASLTVESSPAAQRPQIPSPPADLNDQGTFVLALAGRDYGTEKFNIRAFSDKIEAEAEIQLRDSQDGHSIALQTFPKLVLDSQLHPRTYTWSLKGMKGFHLLVDFTGALAKSQLHLSDGKDDIREFQLPRDVIVLDNNVIHHYQLLVDRYYQTSGGKQAFNAYIPQEAVPGVLTVQDAGMEMVDLKGRRGMLRHLVVLTDNAEIDLWADAQRKLQRLLMATVQLEALRQQ